jgi:hypothetical protein
LHPVFYVVTWIGFSSSVILFNKWLLDTLQFRTSATSLACRNSSASVANIFLLQTTRSSSPPTT